MEVTAGETTTVTVSVARDWGGACSAPGQLWTGNTRKTACAGCVSVLGLPVSYRFSISDCLVLSSSTVSVFHHV